MYDDLLPIARSLKAAKEVVERNREWGSELCVSFMHHPHLIVDDYKVLLGAEDDQLCAMIEFNAHGQMFWIPATDVTTVRPLKTWVADWVDDDGYDDWKLEILRQACPDLIGAHFPKPIAVAIWAILYENDLKGLSMIERGAFANAARKALIAREDRIRDLIALPNRVLIEKSIGVRTETNSRARDRFHEFISTNRRKAIFAKGEFIDFLTRFYIDYGVFPRYEDIPEVILGL